MNDPNWQMLSGPIANEIEQLNYRSQINTLTSLIRFLLEHRGPLKDGLPPMPDEIALKELHRSATLFLLADAGSYRSHEVVVSDGVDVIHKPPPWHQVPFFMGWFFRELSSAWTHSNILLPAAYALWKINWVHPFANGNGRTARAFSYACLSLRIGSVIPGTTTVVEQITTNRSRYEAAIRAADYSFRDTGTADLRLMIDMLSDFLQNQVKSIPNI
jgi:Fic family protein